MEISENSCKKTRIVAMKNTSELQSIFDEKERELEKAVFKRINLMDIIVGLPNREIGVEADGKLDAFKNWLKLCQTLTPV